MTFLIITQFTFANDGDKFPNIKVEKLQHKMIELPNFEKGKYYVIGMN